MNRTHSILTLLALLLLAGCSTEKNAAHSPYASLENREIKALSAQQVSDYLQGHGMSFSLVAELNQYPGPRHVLDLSKALDLTTDQHRQVTNAFQTMQNRAQELGRRLVEKEQQLNRRFAHEHTPEPVVKALLQDIGTLRAELRFTHIQAHMKVKEILTSEQVEQYDELRGYGDGQAGKAQHDLHNHDA